VKVELSADEARVIGALIEKEITTPDQYPLSLNALTNACNQKSNRDPVVHWEESRVQQLLDGLSRRALAMDRSGFGSRVSKYRHLFCNTTFGSLKFSPQELAIVCELLLRGPQTPGELRSHATRMCPFSDVSEVDTTLEQLMNREDGPFVARMAREPGRRESRYAQLFTGTVPDEPSAPHEPAAAEPPPAAPAGPDRLDALERAVQRLEMEVAELKGKIGGEQ
jgi:uncharacterized protein YceH (UPF0502 family)